ncbi:MAG: carbon dioxide concentrating mechanism protein CcmL [Planctomycetes bacterium]|nr:carbon dioxide concentrating mechanism protein CcmL [Planctomycetota bacterium]
MRIMEVIGTVTLSRWHPSLDTAVWRIAVPLSQAGLRGDRTGRGEPVIVYDELGANNGVRIAVSEGAEAAAPFHPDRKPLDAYNAAILDAIEFRS